MFVNDDGSPMTFPETVSAVLVEEHNQTREDADELVKQYPQVMVNGMLGGWKAWRPTALALLMKEREATGGE